MVEQGDTVFLPHNRKAEGEPNGPRALGVTGEVLEERAGIAFVRWTGGLHLARCGVGGGWYATDDLRKV